MNGPHTTVVSMIPASDEHLLSLASVLALLESRDRAAGWDLVDSHQIPEARRGDLLAEIRSLPQEMQYALGLVSIFSSAELSKMLGPEKADAVFVVAGEANGTLSDSPALILLRREEGIEAQNVADQIEWERDDRLYRDDSLTEQEALPDADPTGELSVQEGEE